MLNLNAPWYLRNDDLHRDLEVESVSNIIKRYAEAHERRLHHHVNAEAIQLLDNMDTTKTEKDKTFREAPVQDRSEVKYVNPRYFSDVEVAMFRKRRSAVYLTNLTITTFHTWGANLTFNVSYPLARGKRFNMILKGCEALDKVWMVELLGQFTNVTQCPLPAGRYGYFNMGALPKCFPAPTPSSRKVTSNRLEITIFLTATKEVILKIYLHIQAKKK